MDPGRNCQDAVCRPDIHHDPFRSSQHCRHRSESCVSFTKFQTKFTVRDCRDRSAECLSLRRSLIVVITMLLPQWVDGVILQFVEDRVDQSGKKLR